METQKIPMYKQKKFAIPVAVLLCMGIVFAGVMIASHTVNVNVSEVLSSSQNGQTFDINAEPNADTVYNYKVSNSASVEEYTIVNVTEVSNVNGASYTVSGNRTRVIVPANTVDFEIPLTIHTAADSTVGTVVLTASNERTA